MIWRWSRLNNLKLKSTSPFILRFNSIKFLRAVNFRRFVIGITKFKRIKLARWKRNGSWLPYVSVFKFWIKDFNVNKKNARAQYFNTFSSDSYLIHDFFYTKKKSALNTLFDRYFLSSSVTQTFIRFICKKYNNSSFVFYNSVKNNNIVLAFFINKELVLNDNAPLLLHKNENFFTELDSKIKKIKLFKIFETLIFFKIWTIYRTFIFFTYVKLFCHLNFFA